MVARVEEDGAVAVSTDATPTPEPPRVRLCLASDHPMVAESVRVALGARGIDTVVLRWTDPPPVEKRPDSAVATRAPGAVSTRSARLTRPRHLPDVGLLLSALSSSEPEAEMRSLSTQLPVRWVVLSQRPRGSDWGAALDGGACAVVSGSTRLDEIVTLVRQVVAGRDVMGEAEREELVATWQRVRVESKRRTELLASLSPRERAVLEDLDAGRPVTTIAAASGVSVATVRTQVRGILRKLDVSSQLAAVALLRDVLDRSPMLPRVVAAGRPDHP